MSNNGYSTSYDVDMEYYKAKLNDELNLKLNVNNKEEPIRH